MVQAPVDVVCGQSAVSLQQQALLLSSSSYIEVQILLLGPLVAETPEGLFRIEKNSKPNSGTPGFSIVHVRAKPSRLYTIQIASVFDFSDTESL